MRFALSSLFAPAVATAVLCTALSAYSPAQAQAAPADAARGKVLFLRCASCHAVVAKAPTKVGPSLAGVVGRKGGALPGFGFSAAMKKAGPVWDEAALDRWLTSPNKVVPGTSMAFVGFTNPADRRAMIAYLKTLR